MSCQIIGCFPLSEQLHLKISFTPINQSHPLSSHPQPMERYCNCFACRYLKILRLRRHSRKCGRKAGILPHCLCCVCCTYLRHQNVVVMNSNGSIRSNGSFDQSNVSRKKHEIVGVDECKIIHVTWMEYLQLAIFPSVLYCTDV